MGLHTDPPDTSPTPQQQLVDSFVDPFGRFDERDERELLRAYYAKATFFDAQLGRVLDALERSERSDDTIVVLASDHGYHLGERGWWNKSTLYEYSVRSLLVFSVPGVTRNGVACPSVIEFVDVYPTIADLVDIEMPHSPHGRTLRPLLEEPTQSEHEPAYSVRAYDNVIGRTIRTDRWRYIEWRDRVDDTVLSEELFNHRDDSGEFHDVSRDGKHDTVRARLERTLRDRYRIER